MDRSHKFDYLDVGVPANNSVELAKNRYDGKILVLPGRDADAYGRSKDIICQIPEEMFAAFAEECKTLVLVNVVDNLKGKQYFSREHKKYLQSYITTYWEDIYLHFYDVTEEPYRYLFTADFKSFVDLPPTEGNYPAPVNEAVDYLVRAYR